MTLYIEELRTGKTHRRNIKSSSSVTYKAQNNYIIISDYYSGARLHKFNIKKYGSVRFWIDD